MFPLQETLLKGKLISVLLLSETKHVLLAAQ